MQTILKFVLLEAISLAPLTGEHEGESYKGNMHTTSLAFEWPIVSR